MNKYQVMPDLSPEEFAALREDIKLRGVQDPVLYDEQGNILDGHHRVKICSELGIGFPKKTIPLEEEQKIDFAFSRNLARRNLSPKQKRELARQRLLMDPSISARRIALSLGISHDTVNRLKKELVKSGRLVQTDYTIGADGIKRKTCREPKVKTYDVDFTVEEENTNSEDNEEFITDQKPIEQTESPMLSPAITKEPDSDISGVNQAQLLPIEKYDVIVMGSPGKVINPDDLTNIAIHPSDNSTLWLWVPENLIQEAINSIFTRGFSIKCIQSYVNHEHCIIASKGHPQVLEITGTRDVIGPYYQPFENAESYHEYVETITPGKTIKY